MLIFDKASWHIDAGMDEKDVVDKLTNVFKFLNDKNLLSDEGKEQFEVGIDDSCSLNERCVTDKGNSFLTECYDAVIDCDAETITEALNNHYKKFETRAE